MSQQLCPSVATTALHLTFPIKISTSALLDYSANRLAFSFIFIKFTYELYTITYNKTIKLSELLSGKCVYVMWFKTKMQWHLISLQKKMTSWYFSCSAAVGSHGGAVCSPKIKHIYSRAPQEPLGQCVSGLKCVCFGLIYTQKCRPTINYYYHFFFFFFCWFRFKVIHFSK